MSAALMRLLPTFILMAFWLSLVGVTGFLAYKKKKQASSELLRKQLNFISISSIPVIVGDLAHTAGFAMSVIKSSDAGPISIFGTTFPLRNFAMPFDLIMFSFFYLLFFLFAITRYQDWNFKIFDKILVGFFALTVVALLPCLFVYNISMDYTLLIYSPHMLLFIGTSLIAVSKLVRLSRDEFKRSDDEKDKNIMKVGVMFIVSFVFFIGTIALLPLDSRFGMLMIPKTFAYIAAYFYILKGFVLKH